MKIKKENVTFKDEIISNPLYKIGDIVLFRTVSKNKYSNIIQAKIISCSSRSSLMYKKPIWIYDISIYNQLSDCNIQVVPQKIYNDVFEKEKDIDYYNFSNEKEDYVNKFIVNKL